MNVCRDSVKTRKPHSINRKVVMVLAGRASHLLSVLLYAVLPGSQCKKREGDRGGGRQAEKVGRKEGRRCIEVTATWHGTAPQKVPHSTCCGNRWRCRLPEHRLCRAPACSSMPSYLSKMYVWACACIARNISLPYVFHFMVHYSHFLLNMLLLTGVCSFYPSTLKVL